MKYIHFCAGYKYQLTRDYSVKIPIMGQEFSAKYYSLTRGGVLRIKAGYAWDGPSGPTIDTKSFMRGSLVHDVLYQAIRFGLLPREYRQKADEILRDLCIEDGMWKLRAAWVYWAVRRFAGPAAHPDNVRQDLTAP